MDVNSCRIISLIIMPITKNKMSQIIYTRKQNFSGLSYMVTVTEATRFVEACLTGVGAPESHARTVAQVLISADQRGHYSRGLHRLELILSTILKGICKPSVEPKIIKESPSTLWVDGMHGLGPVVSQFSIEKAIEKAKENIIAVVAAKNSHYNGSLGYYTEQAMDKGMVAFTCANTPLAMCPKRAKQPILGTNPICFGAPGENADSFLHSMTTTVATYGQIVLHEKRNLPLPLGWARDNLGRVTSSPTEALDAILLLPVSDNKGVGLGMFAEILCSILCDADYGKKLVPYRHYATKPASMSHCFIVINAEKIAPHFKIRVSELIKSIRKAELVNPNRPISIPGDVSKFHMRQVQKDGGIIYYPAQIDTCRHLARQLHVSPLQYTKRYLE